MTGKAIAVLSVLLCLLFLSACSKSGQTTTYDADKDSAGTAPESSTEELDYERALAERNQSFDPADTVIHAKDPSFKPAKKDYTLLVYMVGSNLESRLGNATADMEEMLASGLDFNKSNVIVYTGGSRRWAGSVPADKNCVLDLSLKEEERIIGTTDGNADMGAPETLSAFLNFAKEMYASDHYALILWDHGGGPLWGFGSDELFHSDSIMLSELKKALKEGPFHKNDKLDWVGFDACLMGSLESMSMWKDYAGYYVGSEEVEPGNGWDYSFLKILNKTTDPVEVTGEILRCYKAFYDREKTETSNPDITLSVADLSKTNQIEYAMGQLFKGMYSGLDVNQIEYQKYRQESKDFGMIKNEKSGEAFSYDLVDLGSFCSHFQDAFPKEYEAIREGMDHFIINQVSNVEDSSGVTLYYPLNNRGQFRKMEDAYQNDIVHYKNILKKMKDRWDSEAKKSWDIPEPSKEGDEYTLSLTPEQNSNVVGAAFTVLRKHDDGTYSSVLRDCKAEIDSGGKVHIPADPKLIFVADSDKGDEDLWCAAQVENTPSRNVYRSEFAHFTAGDLNAVLQYGYPESMQVITVLFQEDKESGDYQILSIEGDNGDIGFSGKNQVDVQDWITLAQASKLLYPEKELSGTVLPCREWGEKQRVITTWYLEDSFAFEGRNLSSLDEDFYLQVELEDAGGNYYGSPLIALTAKKNYEEKNVNTEMGVIRYHLWKDHAMVSSYTGTDKVITVPGTVDGVPVTVVGPRAFVGLGQETETVNLPDSVEEIRMGAFYNDYWLKEIHLPKSLLTVGDAAFWGCGCLKKLDWPAGVKKWGNLAVAFCDALTELTLPPSLDEAGYGNYTNCAKLREIKGNCKAYKIKDQALFSRDGKTLMAYPCGREAKEYEIPKGTKEIAFSAFAGSRNLKKLIFPEGLVRIGNYAFTSCDGLTGLDFPDSLTDIGTCAFDAARTFDRIWLTDAPAKIRIGKGLKRMGDNTFSNFSSLYFETDPGNKTFKAKDGSLMNRAGDAVRACKVNEYIIYVPDGSLEISDWETVNAYKSKYNALSMIRKGKEVDAFHEYYNRLEMVIPPSVRSIAGVSKLNAQHGGEADELMIHCEKGSYAETFAQENDILYDYNMNPDRKEFTDEREDGTFCYDLYSDHAALVRIEKGAEDITIPDKIQGLPVTVIGDGRKSIESYRTALGASDPERTSPIRSIRLPDTVKEIKDNAFYDSDHLETMALPEGVEAVGKNAFSLNTVLKELPDSIKELGESIGKVEMQDGRIDLPASLEKMSPIAFDRIWEPFDYSISDENKYYTVLEGVLFTKDKKTLVSCPNRETGAYTAAEGTVSVGECAFYGKTLTEITIPKGVTSIGKRAFANSSIASVELPESVTSIGDEAFARTPIESVRIPSSVKKMGSGICSSCKNLKEAVIDEGVTTIGSSAFDSCEQLVDVQMPETLEKIDDFAFAYCDSLQKADFPDSLKVIGVHAFFDDPMFSDFTLPSGLTAIRYGAFEDEITQGEYMPDKPIPLRGQAADTLKIGKDLTDIESKALMNLNFRAFEVDPDNPVYSDREGCLFDKRGTVLYQFPSAVEGTAVVPEGTVGIELDGRNQNTRLIKEIVIPDSVEYIDDTLCAEGLAGVSFRCSKESAAYRYALDHGITITE